MTSFAPTPTAEPKKARLFHHMAIMPWPYLIILPAVFVVLIGIGWTQDSYIEEEVAKIWIPTRGSYAKNIEYAESLGEGDLATTNFAAMAIARDGGNLFTEERLEEIRQRMEKAESTTIEYDGVVYTWDDICASNNAGRGTAYQFPCARLSPMDLFQEARWFFDETDRVTWYQDVIRKLLIKPRLPRFGIMQTSCPAECETVIRLRNDADFAEEMGYPREFAQPLGLFADIGNMELNDPCRDCIEMNFETTIQSLQGYVKNAFGVLAMELGRFYQDGIASNTLNQEGQEMVLDLITKTTTLATDITRTDVEEFYSYYVTRGLYAQLGVERYLAGYQQLQGFLETCNETASLVCPPTTATSADAQQALLNHADNVFSSVTMAGSPLPMWSAGDGTGNLFEGTSPVSGSGIDMSANLFSLVAYLDLFNYGNATAWSPLYTNGTDGFADPVTPDGTWTALVEPNPVYAWFMAGLTNAEHQCGNGVLTGTAIPNDEGQNAFSAKVMAGASQFWCTKYNVPNAEVEAEADVSYTKQHFARMFYDLMIDSPGFLDLVQGEDDPYTWTTGQGCGYFLRGERDIYTNQTDESILLRASRELYYIDEGETVGVVDRNLLLGGITPRVGDYSFENPLQEVGVLQTLYVGLLPDNIVERVKNCNRPGGSVDITVDAAEDILRAYKEAFEDAWSEGWDKKDDGEVQFVLFSDDNGVIGTTGRMLRDITLDNGKLMAVSILLIALFSVMILISPNWIESRVLITLIGVGLVLLAFFASIGLAILIGIKVNVTIAWTLPFIILGLGVDDVYIVLMALKKQKGYREQNFIKAMKEVAVPVTMTSLVNCSMFAVMNLSDIPAIYKTANVAVIAVIFLYASVIVCYPAFCYQDMKRQAASRYDFFFCWKKELQDQDEEEEEVPHTPESLSQDFREIWLYDRFYKPLILGTPSVRRFSHAFVFLATSVLFGLGVYGITEREIGLGLEDFFPVGDQSNRWATVRTEELASWSIGMNWGPIDYTNPDTQLKMIKQFENVVATEYVAKTDTKFLWIADFAIWSTRQCDDNFDRENPDVLECGGDQYHVETDSYCAGSWVRNTYGLNEKNFADPRGACQPYENGICRSTGQMFDADLQEAGYDPILDTSTVWCPVMDWEDEKFLFCMTKWRNITNFSGGRFVFESEEASPTACDGEYYKDQQLQFPLPFSSGPTMFSFNMLSHALTLEMLEQTRKVCDDGEIHCWMTGIPYDYWSQYDDIFKVLIELGLSASAVGFGISWAFLFAKLSFEGRHERRKIFWGSLVGALLITATILTSLITVIGLSALADVSLTGFSNMSFVLSVGFAVEYSVHIVARWIRAENSMTSSLERVKHTMSFLMLPTFMSFVSSTIGVVCLAFTDFEFNRVFFFRPLLIVMMVTYFIGCYSLPAFLTYLDFEVCRLGKTSPEASVYFTKSFVERDLDTKESTARDETHASGDVVDKASTKSASDSAHEQAHKEAPESLKEEEIE